MTPEIADTHAFALSPGERGSPVWRKILEHLKGKLELARAKNDGPQDATVTATLRGQIGLLKELIALDQDLPILD